MSEESQGVLTLLVYIGSVIVWENIKITHRFSRVLLWIIISFICANILAFAYDNEINKMNVVIPFLFSSIWSYNAVQEDFNWIFQALKQSMANWPFGKVYLGIWSMFSRTFNFLKQIFLVIFFLTEIFIGNEPENTKKNKKENMAIISPPAEEVEQAFVNPYDYSKHHFTFSENRSN